MKKSLEIRYKLCTFVMSKITALCAATLSGLIVLNQKFAQAPAYRERAATSVMLRQDLGFFMSKITGLTLPKYEVENV